MTTAAPRALANPAATRKLAMGIQRAAGPTVGSAGNRNGAASVASMAPFAAAALPSLASAAASSSSSSAHRDGAQVGNDEYHGANAPSAGLGVGRVAAAAQAFSGGGAPPTPASASSAATAPSKPATPGRLVPQKVSELKRSYGLVFPISIRSAGSHFLLPPFCLHSLVLCISVAVVVNADDMGGRCWVAMGCDALSVCLSLSL